MRGFLRISILAALVLAVAGGAALVASARDAASGSTVRVTLSEMKVVTAKQRSPAGKVTFVVRNSGTIEHELVIVRAAGAGGLPVRAYKAQEGNGVIAEIEDIEPGKTGRLTTSLGTGRYLLICNIVGHYQLGMSATLRVG
jgi:uncharacterized cupredoxin-like copper-binding protein